MEIAQYGWMDQFHQDFHEISNRFTQTSQWTHVSDVRHHFSSRSKCTLLELEHHCKRSVWWDVWIWKGILDQWKTVRISFFSLCFCRMRLKLHKFCNSLDYNFSELSKKLSIWWKGHDFLVSSDLSFKTNKVLTLKIARVFRIISFQASICSLTIGLRMEGIWLLFWGKICSNQIVNFKCGIGIEYRLKSKSVG